MLCYCFITVHTTFINSRIIIFSILQDLFLLFYIHRSVTRKEIGEETGVNIEFPGVLKKQYMEFSDINKKAVEFAGETKNKVMMKF